MGSSVIRKMKREQARVLAFGGAAPRLNDRLDRIEAMAQEAIVIATALQRVIARKFPDIFEEKTESGLTVVRG